MDRILSFLVGIAAIGSLLSAMIAAVYFVGSGGGLIVIIAIGMLFACFYIGEGLRDVLGWRKVR